MIGLTTTILVIVLLSILSFLSVVESAISQLSRLSIMVLAEKKTEVKYALLSDMAEDRRHFMIPIQVGIQLTMVSTVVLVAVNLSRTGGGADLALWLSLLAAVGVVSIFRQLVPYLLTYRDPEGVLLRILPSFSKFYKLLCLISLPITGTIRLFVKNHGPTEEAGDEEASDEEIQAYLGVGEEEGIFERAESRLIQSALEFGSTLVREIMTPRGEMIAIEERATVGELKNLIIEAKHSRIPVYREKIDRMVGMVHLRNLLPHLEPGREDASILPIVSKVLIVPETKRVSELLTEMQAKAEQMAIVINEYGTVSGLVTVEDLLEEIVGDIRDEDESLLPDISYEGEGSYVVRGSVEVEEVEDVLGLNYGEHEAATLSGLVVDHLGAVPSPGESVVIDGTVIEVLSSDHRRIHKLRVRVQNDGEQEHAS